MSDFRRQGLAVGHTLDHRFDLLTREALQRDRDEIGPRSPRGLKLGPTRHENQEPGRRRLVHQQGEEFQRGVIHPVEVLDDHEDWLLFGELEQESQDGFHGLLLLALRCQSERDIASFWKVE
jgi:hypothetical protein